MPDFQVTIVEETLDFNIIEESFEVSVADEGLPFTLLEETVTVPIMEEIFNVGPGDEPILITIVEENFNVVLDEIFETIVPEGAVPYMTAIDTEGTIVYKGEAAPGSQASASVWRIRRISFTDNGQDLIIEWADGSSAFNQIWDDRLSLTYS